VDKNLRKPSEYFKSNIYVDTMGPSAIGLKAMIEMCGVDRVLFGTDFGPVPISPKVHIDLVNDTITDATNRDKIFSTNALTLLRLSARTQLDRRGVAASA
jgi:predicted TIM-barrel fold metal-dependent hydrolase